MKKIQKIKQHVSYNKETYIAGGVCLVVGLTSGLAFGCASNGSIKIRPVQILTWKSKQTIEVFVEALGDPGNVIQDTTTGIIYASQRQAAKELGLNPSRVSEQVRGLRDTVNGHKFDFLGKAGVATAA